MKQYNEIIRFINKREDFSINQIGRTSTVKICHLPSKTARTCHPGNNAYHPIRRWLKKFDIDYGKEKK
jgi:hypothetical protein